MNRSAKDALRRRMRGVRGGIDPARLAEVGPTVAERVLSLPELDGVERVLCYLSVRREVPTGPLIDGLRERGVTVAVPRVTGPRTMEARELVEPLAVGEFGVPTSDGPVVKAVQLCICPGLAFDELGYRLGYGAAYYDTWLTAHPVPTVALAVDEAIVQTVPTEPHDRRMDVVVTPSRVLRPPAPLRVVAGAWLRDGRVLAAQRSPTQTLAGLWELPGGKVEVGERDEDALVRELREELRVGVRVVGSPICVVEHLYGERWVRLIVHEVRDGDGPVEPVATEHVALRWLGRAELDEVEWAPADVPALARIADRLA